MARGSPDGFPSLGVWESQPCTGVEAQATIVCLRVVLVRGVDADDRMLRRHAGCLADPNTTLHSLTASSASGTVVLSAEGVEERLRDQLERGELTMAKIRADYARYYE